MAHPKIEDINANAVHWIESDFVKALMLFHVSKKEFKFQRILRISKVWKDGDHWIVDVLFEYGLGTSRSGTVTFQMNLEGKIIGYNVNEPERI
jgi:hypothetical protein